MAFVLVKPALAGDTISRLASGSINADDSGQAQRFYMKVGSYQIQTGNQPFDCTAEGDSFLDIRHLGFLSGNFSISGWMVNHDINIDGLRDTAANKNVAISLTLGKDSDDNTIRTVNFDALVTKIQIQYQKNSPFVAIVIGGTITGSYSSSEEVVNETSISG